MTSTDPLNLLQGIFHMNILSAVDIICLVPVTLSTNYKLFQITDAEQRMKHA